MIRKSPAEYYIKFLISHPDEYDNDRIQEILEVSQLDSLGHEYVDRLRGACVPPYPFFPTDPMHMRSQRFLIREKIQGLFLPDATSKRALELLGQARAKEFLESMVLSGAPSVLIARALTAQRRFPCTTEVIDRYRHFFWNIDLVDSTELRAILMLRTSKVDGPEGKALYHASFDDPRRVAADLPNAPLVALLSQMKMGFMPREVDLARILDATRKAAALRAYEASLRGGPRDSTRAMEFSTVTKIMGDVLETVVKPDERLREELATIALRTEESPVPFIHELSEGRHTVDMQPKMVTYESESGAGSPPDVE